MHTNNTINTLSFLKSASIAHKSYPHCLWISLLTPIHICGEVVHRGFHSWLGVAVNMDLASASHTSEVFHEFSTPCPQGTDSPEVRGIVFSFSLSDLYKSFPQNRLDFL